MERLLYIGTILLLFWLAGCEDEVKDTTNPYRLYSNLEEALQDSTTAEYLSLKNIGDSLSPTIGKLKKLRSLWVTNSEIRFLPDEINDLQELADVLLENNEFRSIPPQLFKLPRLHQLFLPRNSIMELPGEIADTQGLIILNLIKNQFTSFPSRQLNLGSVRSLYLDSNQIAVINIDSLDAPHLEKLSLQGNPIPVSMRDELRRRMPGVEIVF